MPITALRQNFAHSQSPRFEDGTEPTTTGVGNDLFDRSAACSADENSRKLSSGRQNRFVNQRSLSQDSLRKVLDKNVAEHRDIVPTKDYYY